MQDRCTSVLVVRRSAEQLAPHGSDRLPRLRDEQVPRTGQDTNYVVSSTRPAFAARVAVKVTPGLTMSGSCG